MSVWEAVYGLGETGAILAAGVMIGTEHYFYAAGLSVIGATLGAIHLALRDERVKYDASIQVSRPTR